jgi:solute carrier family 6 amino acid transporter-like protein 5/7/9/14
MVRTIESFISIYYISSNYFFTVYLFIGLDRVLQDIKFMLGIELGIYWKFCWKFLIPFSLAFFFIYDSVTFEQITYADVAYPDIAICKIFLLKLF